MLDFTLIAIAAAALGVAVFALYESQLLRRRLDGALGGQNPDSLEEQLKNSFASLGTIETQLQQLNQNYAQLAKIAANSLQKIAIVRFNPYSNTGGDQSFVLAVLDNHDNGCLMTSIHSREGTRIYIKPIEYGRSGHKLSQEEEAALKQAANKGVSDGKQAK